MITLAGAATGALLALTLAGPASASDAVNPADTPQLQAWRDAPTVTASSVAAPVATKSLATTRAVAAAAATAGSRIDHKRGSVWLWTENSLEWYWNSSKITSSTGWQSDGYIFPNTASKGGISRTYKGSTQHNWRGTMIAGSGIVTPWGAVDVYRTSITDYYYLKRGGAYTIN
jgi:hypothetical protein